MRVKPVPSLLLCLTCVVAAQDAPETRRPLSLEESITLALQHNFDIQIRRYDPELSRYSLAGAYGNYEPVFSLSGGHSYSLSPGGVDSEGRGYTGTESETDRFGSGIQGLLPWGLTYNLGGSVSDQNLTRPGTIPDRNSAIVVTNSFVDINSGNTISFLSTNYGTIPTRIPFETSSGEVGYLTLRQPLLKNFWIDSTRLQIYVDKKNLKISELGLRSQIMATVTDVEQAYYNLIYQEENVRVQEKALELAERLLAENRRRVEVGALAPLDEKQAESQVAASRAELLAAQASRDTAERLLKNLLSDDYTNSWAGVRLQTTEKLLAVPQTFDLQESWQRGLSQRPDLLQARLTLEKQDYMVRYQRNQVYPQLDLVGSYGYSAGGTSREYSDAFGQMSRGDNPFYSVGAQLSIPLGQTGARNTYKAAKATREQLLLQLRKEEQAALILIENSTANARIALQRVEATRQARLYAEAALGAEQKKLESGKSTSFVVLQLQRDLTTARSAEIRALADYNIALAQISLNEGSTLERHRLDMEFR